MENNIFMNGAFTAAAASVFKKLRPLSEEVENYAAKKTGTREELNNADLDALVEPWNK
jgi:hypothetical protein